MNSVTSTLRHPAYRPPPWTQTMWQNTTIAGSIAFTSDRDRQCRINYKISYYKDLMFFSGFHSMWHFKSKRSIILRSIVGKLSTLSNSIMVYYTLKWFAADDGCKSCSCSSSHSTTALKGQKGLSRSIQTAMWSAYHPCDFALWWLHHAECGLWGIDS